MSFWSFVLGILLVFVLVACFALLFLILGDLITDHELSGWAKAAWLLGLLVLPLLGSVGYLVLRGGGMADRRSGSLSHWVAPPGSVSGGAATAAQDLSTANTMLASGAITGREHADLTSRSRP